MTALNAAAGGSGAPRSLLLCFLGNRPLRVCYARSLAPERRAGTKIAHLLYVDTPTPLPVIQITFLGSPPSPAVESATRDEIDALTKFNSRLVSCRVAIEGPHHHEHEGEVYRIRIELCLPGKVFVVGHASGHHLENADVYVALRDAFSVARRQLLDHDALLRDETKTGFVSY